MRSANPLLSKLSISMLSLGVASVPAFAGFSSFAPHRAVYEISLLRASSGAGVADMEGRMVYELTGSACEGFTQNMRFVTRSSNGEGVETVNDLRTSSWEEIAGKRLRFSSSQYQNDKLIESSQGDGARAKDTGSTNVTIAEPEKQRLQLPADIHFPMQHAAALIDAAKSGKTMFTAPLYDGSEKGTKYFLTTAVIGKRAEPGAVALASSKSSAELQKLASWPMSISYFETGKDKQDSLPSYELAFRYFENGITSDLRIDYGAFALKGELKQLELLQPSKCDTASP